MRSLYNFVLLTLSLTLSSTFLLPAWADALTAPVANDVQAAPIPQAESGTVEFKELKPTLSLDVTASQSRVFRTKTKIKRVAVSDPTIAEPVVVSDHEF